MSSEPVRPPHPRHWIRAVNQRSVAKAVNSVIESWVDVEEDVAAINRREAVRRGNTHIVNGRTYGVKPTGRLYPIAGAGIHQLSRGAYKALGVYNVFGLSARALQILDALGIVADERAKALAAWRGEQESRRR